MQPNISTWTPLIPHRLVMLRQPSRKRQATEEDIGDQTKQMNLQLSLLTRQVLQNTQQPQAGVNDQQA